MAPMSMSLLSSLPRSIVLLGDYGSGKTEVAVNLALQLAQEAGPEDRVVIADLDLVNPYFRCREAREPLEQAGVEVVMPRGGHEFADLPILLPRVKGLFAEGAARAVLDVGGDEAGSRVLSALAPDFDPSRHAVLFVVNESRPFNDSVQGCTATIRRIERSSGLPVTGLVSNSHLMNETGPAIVQQGLVLSRALGEALGIPVVLLAVMAELGAELPLEGLGVPVLLMQRLMVPPWLRRPGVRPGPGMFRGL